MQNLGSKILLVLAVIFFGVSQALFTVDETEQAIILQFGQPIGEKDNLVKKPGLHFKMPFIQQVRYFDSRILSVDPQPERMNVSAEKTKKMADKKADENKETPEERIFSEASGEPILVDTFARYRITDPLAFLKTLQTIPNAAARIGGIMNDNTRNVLGKITLSQILSEQRTGIMGDIRDRVNKAIQEGGFGVEIVDIRIVRADLTEKLRTSTVNRMITELREQATETRAQGRELALEIRSKAEKDRTVILAEANKQSQIIRGEGDRTAIATYASAFNKDPSFYGFIRSMEAYGNTLADEDTQLILSPDSEFLKYIKSK